MMTTARTLDLILKVKGLAGSKSSFLLSMVDFTWGRLPSLNYIILIEVCFRIRRHSMMISFLFFGLILPDIFLDDSRNGSK